MADEIPKPAAVSAGQGQLPDDRNWQSTGIYALQIVIAAALLLTGYRLARAPSVVWALVSSAMVLQPGFKQSLAASMSRIAANLVGAGVGLTIGLLIGDSAGQYLLALVVTVFVCQSLRLEQSLRSACVSVTIVMLSYESHFVTSGIERCISVMIGCGAALLVQYSTNCLHPRR